MPSKINKIEQKQYQSKNIPLDGDHWAFLPSEKATHVLTDALVAKEDSRFRPVVPEIHKLFREIEKK